VWYGPSLAPSSPTCAAWAKFGFCSPTCVVWAARQELPGLWSARKRQLLLAPAWLVCRLRSRRFSCSGPLCYVRMCTPSSVCHCCCAHPQVCVTFVAHILKCVALLLACTAAFGNGPRNRIPEQHSKRHIEQAGCACPCTFLLQTCPDTPEP